MLSMSKTGLSLVRVYQVEYLTSTHEEMAVSGKSIFEKG